MEPYAFIVCAGLCLIQHPTSGIPREACIARMEKSQAWKPETRVICQSLNWPRGEIIDSMPWLDPPWKSERARDSVTRATLPLIFVWPNGAEAPSEMTFPSILACENHAAFVKALPRTEGQPYTKALECMPHLQVDTLIKSPDELPRAAFRS